MTLLLFVVAAVVVLLLVGLPVAFAFGLAALVFGALADADLSYLVPNSLWSTATFSMLALPLFIMTGAMMNAAGISDRLIDFVERLVGQAKGGLGAVTVVTCTIFGAISGSGASAIAAIGSIMLPRLQRVGYTPGYSSALVACSSVIALLIPPSIPMIVFALTTRIPVTAAFLSTVGAGLLVAVAFCVINYFAAPRAEAAGTTNLADVKDRLSTWALTKRASFALLMPVILLGGIYSGAFTPTESAAIALGYAIIVGVAVYRSMGARDVLVALSRGALLTGSVILVVFFLFAFNRVLVVENIPREVSDLLLSVSDNPIVVLALINVILLVMGMLIDDISASILAAVILFPTVQQLGLHPLHFAAIVGTNISLGNVTPPCAPLLYMAGGIGGAGLADYIRPAFLFICVGHLPVLLAVTYWPDLSLFLPRLILGIG